MKGAVMGLSVLNFTASQNAPETFALSFALGFIERGDVQVRVNTAVDGSGDPAYETDVTWIDDSNLTVNSGFVSGDTIQITRTVDKDQLEVDFTVSSINGLSLNQQALQNIMIYHELVDGRIGGDASPFALAEAAAASAVLAAASATDAETAKTGAETAETNAGTQATAAAASATAAAASAAAAAGAAGADMLAAMYDPTTVQGDAFDMSNMAETAGYKVMTGAERTILSNITTFAKTLLDDTTAVAMRATLGLSDAAVYTIASAGSFFANTANRVLTSTMVWADAAEVTLTYANPRSLDLDTGINFVLTLTGDTTISNFTNGRGGLKGRIRIVQDGTGGHEVSWGSYYKFGADGAPTITATANAEDFLQYEWISSTRCEITVNANRNN